MSKYMVLSDYEKIVNGVANGDMHTTIAKSIGKTTSTVSAAIRRSGGQAYILKRLIAGDAAKTIAADMYVETKLRKSNGAKRSWEKRPKSIAKPKEQTRNDLAATVASQGEQLNRLEQQLERMLDILTKNAESQTVDSLQSTAKRYRMF